MSEVFEIEGKVKLDTDGFKSGLSEIEQQTEKSGQQMSAGTVALGNAVYDVSKKVVSGIVNIGKSAIEYNAQMENYTARLTTALGSQKEAVQAIADIKADAAASVFDTTGLVEANALLMSAGVKANESRAAINALGVAVAASGGGNDVLARMANNLLQVKNVGKATTMDIRQFAMAGIDIYGLLSDYTGKSVKEVQELDVTYEMLSGALQKATEEGGKFYGAMDAQMSTFNGQMSMLKSNVDEKLGGAFEGLTNVLSQVVLPDLNAWVSSIDSADIPRKLTEITVAFTALTMGANWDAMVAGIAKVGASLTTLLANPAFLAAAAIAGITVATIEGINAFNDYTDSLAETDGTLEGMTSQLNSLKARQLELEEIMKDPAATEFYQSEYDSCRIAISNLEQQIADFDSTPVVDNAQTSADALSGIMSTFEEGMTQLMADYNAAYENTLKSVSGWFDVFEQVKETVPASLSEMQSALQSQIDFNNTYSQNLQALKEYGLGDLATAFQEMGDEGAQFAAAMAEALTTGNEAQVETIKQLYEDVQASKENISSTLTDITGEYEASYNELIEQTRTAINDLDLGDEATAAAHATMMAYAEGILSGGDVAASNAHSVGWSIASGVQAGINSYGAVTITVNTKRGGGDGGADGYPASGLEYVPYNQFSATLHKGEAVLTKEEADVWRAGQSQGGGGVVINQNIQSVALTPVELAAATEAYFQQARWAFV